MNRSDAEAGFPLSRRDSLRMLGGGMVLWGMMKGSGQHAFAGPPDAPKPAATETTSINWDEIAKQFSVDPSITYLNTGSLGATPRGVIEVDHAAEQRIETNPVGLGFGPVLTEAEQVRAKLAELLGAKTEEVAVTRNTTDGMNLVAQGLDLQSGDHVLTSNHEHPGGVRCWQFLAKRRGIVLDVAEIPAPPENEDQVVERFRAALTPRTRVISVSHITFSTGVRVPIARLAELAHKNDALLVVDGAQGPGGIAVDVKALGCDTYATSGHKWLLGPKGTGILYISEAARERIAPMQLDDGLGVYTAIGGTVNLPEVIGLGAVVDWTKRIGREAIFARLMKLRNRLYEELHATPGIRIASPPPLSPLAAHYLCFSVEGQDKHKATADAFAAEKVVVKTVHHGGIDYRIGCHLNNTEADIERFSRVLRKSLT